MIFCRQGRLKQKQHVGNRTRKVPYFEWSSPWPALAIQSLLLWHIFWHTKTVRNAWCISLTLQCWRRLLFHVGCACRSCAQTAWYTKRCCEQSTSFHPVTLCSRIARQHHKTISQSGISFDNWFDIIWHPISDMSSDIGAAILRHFVGQMFWLTLSITLTYFLTFYWTYVLAHSLAYILSCCAAFVCDWHKLWRSPSLSLSLFLCAFFEHSRLSW